MAVPAICTDMMFFNFGQVGQCLVQETMFGDLALAGLLISIVFLLIVVKHNLPFILLLPLSFGLSFTLWLLSGGASIFLAFFLLSTMINGAVMILALLNYLNR